MASEKCLYCGETFNIDQSTEVINSTQFPILPIIASNESVVKTILHKCPACKNIRIIVSVQGGQFGKEKKSFNVFPTSDAIKFPSYVPEYIRKDYEEACSIINLSPKASGTLFRRTLEEIIKNFYKISKENLFKDINELEKNSKVDVNVIESLQALRKVGNIGAHLKKDSNKIPEDISSNEAKVMRFVIEDLIQDTYIKDHDRKEHIKKMTEISENK